MRAILIYTRNKTKKKKNDPLFSRSRSFTKLKIICCKQNSSKRRLDYFIKIFCYVKENFTIFHCSFFTAPPRPSDFFCAGSLSILNENKIQTTATKKKKCDKNCKFLLPFVVVLVGWVWLAKYLYSPGGRGTGVEIVIECHARAARHFFPIAYF